MPVPIAGRLRINRTRIHIFRLPAQFTSVPPYHSLTHTECATHTEQQTSIQTLSECHLFRADGWGSEPALISERASPASASTGLRSEP